MPIEFEHVYITLFKSVTREHPEEVHRALSILFSDTDTYNPYDHLRADDEYGDADLMAAAALTFARLNEFFAASPDDWVPNDC